MLIDMAANRRRSLAPLVVLLLILAILQYRLWFAQGSLAEQRRLELQVEEQSTINRQLRARNAVLEREVLELQNGLEGVEQRAREELVFSRRRRSGRPGRR